MASAAISNVLEDMNDEQVGLIRDELEKICQDPLFRDTTRMKRFLRYVTEETIEGRGARLKGYVIGIEVFDRPDDFDPQADTIVRVQAGQLRRRLDLYYSERGLDSPVRILVPKGRYAPTFEMRQMQVANEVADLKTLVRNVTQGSNDPRPSIAVMTLDDLSVRNEQDTTRFAEGLSAEIVNALVQFRAMRIVTMTPSVSSTMAEKSSKDIGQECGADFVLSGSVRRDGEVFRVTVSLIRCDTSEHLFSRVFDREYEAGSVFAVQEEIASYTASAVAAPFGAVNRFNRLTSENRQESMEAYDCVLRYYDMKIFPTRNGAETLLADTVRVTDENPEFSAGWSIRALLNAFLATQCIPVVDAEGCLIEADRTARRALSVDSQNALGYYALFQSYYHRGQFEDADRMIRRALSLNPNDYSMLAYYAICLALRGEFDRASVMQSAALRLIGRAPAWYHLPQLIIAFKSENYEAVAGLIDLSAKDIPALSQLFGLAAKGYLGDIEAARNLVDDILRKTPTYSSEVSVSIRLWHVEPELADQVYKGLLLTGLDIKGLKSSI